MDLTNGTFLFQENQLTFQFNETLRVTIFSQMSSILLNKKEALFLYFQNGLLAQVSDLPINDFSSPFFGVLLENFEELPFTYVNRYFTHLVDSEATEPIPSNLLPILDDLKSNLLSFLSLFSLHFPENKPKKIPAKAQHRFQKDFATLPFYVNDFESTATVYWEKRNELRIKKGALLKKEPPLNKDGSLGLSAKMGLRLREEQADKIENFTTTSDIILKSVNEVGLFLYFGQTNSWLVLKDEKNRTLHDYSLMH